MTEASYDVGENFRVHFVWKLPSEDYLRAIYEVEVLHLDGISNKYVIRLTDFLAGRQESTEGEMRRLEEISREYWSLAADLEGRKISIAYEADDGRPLWLRLETLAGEHNFFRRLNELPEKFKDWSFETE